MGFNGIDQMKSGPLNLSARQQDVLQSLRSRETDRYPLSQWYLGALNTVSDKHNSDRFSQAAHSLRELIEKLPLVIHESDVQVGRYDVTSHRRDIYNRLQKDRKRYADGWSSRRIDPQLSNTLRRVENYFKSVQRPSRREKIQRSVASIDPLADQLDKRIQDSKLQQILHLWQELEQIAHHRRTPKASEFEESLRSLEVIILDLLAPITAQDQNEIQSILSQTCRSNEDANRLFELIEKRGANYVLFFRHAQDTSWISLLKERGYFSNPPNSEDLGDGQVSLRNWWPIVYLSRVSSKSPDEVVDIVLTMPPTDNPRVYKYILATALNVPGPVSIRLMPKLLEHRKLRLQTIPHRFAELLAYLAKESQSSAALEIAESIIRFLPDPHAEYKRNRRGENAGDWTTLLEPSPQFSDLDYRMILEKGLNPLAEKRPYDVARLLIDVVAEMIELRMHGEELKQANGQDKSEIWCRRLRGEDSRNPTPEEAVVFALTSACEKTFAQLPELALELDCELKKQPWRIFQRLRHHLYALFPNGLTLPRIRASILGYGHYGQREFSHEFQRMARRASDHYKDELLARSERISIFDRVVNGPPESQFRTWMGSNFSEQAFEAYKRHFHRKQLRPFASILFGQYVTYFENLEGADDSTISDEDYGPVGEIISGGVRQQSPLAPSEMMKLNDEELLSYVNEWESERRNPANPLVEICIEGLAEAFKATFREVILPNSKRFKFWLENKHRIERPIYVRAILNELEGQIRAKVLGRSNETLELTEWILTHPDKDASEGYEVGERSRQDPKWNSSRLAVIDLFQTCLGEEISLPTVATRRMIDQVAKLSGEYDWRLDSDNRVFPPGEDKYSEAINYTRSRALRVLIQLGLRLRTLDQQTEALRVMSAIERRFELTAEFPMSLPEYAILGAHFGQLTAIDKEWANRLKDNVFPSPTKEEWQVAFESLVLYCNPFAPTFEMLRDNFRLAIQHLGKFKKSNDFGDDFTETLGYRLFVYYVWDLDQLEAADSLIDQFYRKTKDKSDVWERLFRRIGSSLPEKCDDLPENMRVRLASFFEWRLMNGRKTELKQFEFWLNAKCLSPEWRLNAFSRILDFAHPDGWEIYGQCRSLLELLEKHTKQVVECFAKMTDGLRQDSYHIAAETAAEIIGAGLQSVNEGVKTDALRAQENLLRLGRSDLLNLGAD